MDAVATGISKDGGGAGPYVRGFAVVFDLIVASMFVGIGWMACKGHRWAYVVGLVIYSIDAVIMLAFQEWFGFAFHLWALYGIWNGYKAIGRLTQGADLTKMGSVPA